MAATALDVNRLKNLVILAWREGGGNTLVKVMPKGSRVDPARNAGYCTTIKFIIGRTPSEMERILGFRSETKLSDGAEIFRVFPLPSASQFSLRGFTHTPEGISTSEKAYHPDYPPGAGAPQWELNGYPQSQLIWLATVERGEVLRYRVADLPTALPVNI